jgi:hypothetical protein
MIHACTPETKRPQTLSLPNEKLTPEFFKKRLVVLKEESRDGVDSCGYFPHFDG